MRHKTSYKIGLDDVGAGRKMHLRTLMLLIQKIFSAHMSTLVDVEQMYEDRISWVMTKMELDIKEHPAFGQELQMSTWIRDLKKHKAYREFEVEVKGRPMLAVQIEWVRVNMDTKRISPMAPDEMNPEDFEKSDDLADCISRWRPTEPDGTGDRTDIQLRQSDFDIHGHINNTVYFDLLETYLAARAMVPTKVRLAFKSEVPHGTRSISLETYMDEKLVRFRFALGETSCCIGEVALS